MNSIKKITVYVPAVNASGSADCYVYVAEVTSEEHDLGVHYDQARDAAVSAGFEPMGAADENEPLGRLLANAFSAQSPLPRVMVWCGEGGVETVVSESKMDYLVVSTDVSDLEDLEALTSITLPPVDGFPVEYHRTLCFSGACEVNPDQIASVWDQVKAAEA